ncbi:hypothetical protein [Microbacterium candidum]|uniref:Uncharacterized protein n=1 Tax=Microbacterium candidum TaxID=3041922 RepID=A0ABT7MW31_9MICO|nr:hypothetical protein [Microbacterium sp. ASV49]MDL9978628.1 hypothetical protein [Microbacterium sp. ASV49]
MIPILVSALMWLLVASQLILRRGRAERSILYSAVTIAIATTLNIDGLYLWVDRLFGGTNVVTLLADLALMVGIFFLGRAIAKASQHTSGAVRIALGRGVLGVALAGVVVAFFFIDRGPSTTTFMLDLGAQPAAAVYSMIQFTYDAIVLAAMVAVTTRQVRGTKGAERVPPFSVLVGSVLGIALSIVIIVMDVAHVTGDLGLMLSLGEVYGPLYLATFVFLCAGLAGQPAVRRAQARSRADHTRDLVEQVTPIWQRATAVRPGLSQVADAGFNDADAETQLHREIVEIRDAVIDPEASFALTDDERELLEEAEAQLIGGDPARGDRSKESQ